MANKPAFVFFVFLLFTFGAKYTNGQTESESIRDICTKTKPVPRPKDIGIVSLGVISGKALLLTKPTYPPAATAQSINGDVHVSVLIDPRGCVVESKVLSGNIFLRSRSLEAAGSSVFIPTKLSGTPVWVYGVITYRYRSGSMNWLELGYRSDDIEELIEYLPSEFDSVSRDLKKLRSTYGEEREIRMASIREDIKVELLVNPKSLWLFNAGSLLKETEKTGLTDSNRRSIFGKIQSLTETEPPSLSPYLTRLLRELLELSEPDHIRSHLTLIKDRLSELGR